MIPIHGNRRNKENRYSSFEVSNKPETKQEKIIAIIVLIIFITSLIFLPLIL